MLGLPAVSRKQGARETACATQSRMTHGSAGIARRSVYLLLLLLIAAPAVLRAQAQTPAPGPGDVAIEANQQRRQGDVLYADGDVEIRYGDLRLRADHAEYNTATEQVVLRDHVQLDQGSQHMEADRAELNLRSGRGGLDHVHGEVHIERAPNASLLLSPNPLSFEATSVERTDDHTYTLNHAIVTVCDPNRPKWTFNAARATLEVDHHVALVRANFRLFRVPLFYLPYATAPAGQKTRQSGFMLPDVGSSSTKGNFIGDAYYWAPTDWADITAGAEYLSRRGSSQTVDLRVLPWENVSLYATYFGVIDRGLANTNGVLVPAGGHTLNVKFDAHTSNDWHLVANVEELSSLAFRLAFSPTFGEAVNSELSTGAFATNNFRGFSINFDGENYKDFLTAAPETAIVLRRAPEARVSLMDRAPWRRWPVYFGFDTSAGAMHRSDTLIETQTYVERTEFAPRVTMPLHWGPDPTPWIGLTPSFTFRATDYGEQQNGDNVVNSPILRATGELTVDLRPVPLERIWARGTTKWKHTIEPDVVYRYVTGVNEFGRFIRFDEDDTLTDTSEIEYSLTQRLFRRHGDTSEEFASWRIAQKYYFDPTFGGALIPGQRNVFQAFDSISPFAFADGPRRYSPIVSDMKVSPGGRYDAELRMEFDPARHRLTTAEALLKMTPYRNVNLTLAHYAIDGTPALQPLANQIRALVGYGGLNTRGWSGSVGLSYDLRQGILQNQIAQIGYNGSCCGLAFEYVRLALGQIRNENQFRIALTIANIGSFGNVRHPDKIF